MYIYTVRDTAYLLELKHCIEESYDIPVQTIEPAKRGTYGETWKIKALGIYYFVKIHDAAYMLDIYKESLVTIEYLWNYGINYINHVLKTKRKGLYTSFRKGILAIFHYIVGETKKQEQIADLYQLLTKIYTVPTTNLKIRTERFSTYYAHSILERIEDTPILVKNKEILETYIQQLDIYSERCKTSYENLYITHGDSVSNVIEDGEKITIIDWDNAKISCPERDVWFLIRNVQQIEQLNQILYKANIDYRLKKERLLFQCYYNYFYYLQHHLYTIDSFFEEINKKIIERYIHHFFFGGNIVKQIEKIETICETYHE